MILVKGEKKKRFAFPVKLSRIQGRVEKRKGPYLFKWHEHRVCYHVSKERSLRGGGHCGVCRH